MMWRGGVCVAANFGDVPVVLPAAPPGGAARLLLASDPAVRLDRDGDGDSGTSSIELPAASIGVFR
jgi:maltooligosyltrehalose trehalohydrolase